MRAPSIFSIRLRELREEKGLTQGELGEALGVSRASVSFYEIGSRVPDIETLRVMSLFFGCTSDYLLGLSGNRRPENAEIGERLGFSDKLISFFEGGKALWNDFDNHTEEIMIGKAYDRAELTKIILSDNRYKVFLDRILSALEFDEMFEKSYKILMSSGRTAIDEEATAYFNDKRKSVKESEIYEAGKIMGEIVKDLIAMEETKRNGQYNKKG